MKRRIRVTAVAGAVCASALVLSAQTNAAVVTVDSTTMTNGYMTVFNLPSNGGGYQFGSGWGVGDLNSSFSGNVATVAPNSSIDRDNPADAGGPAGYWWTNDANPASPGNKNMVADLYAEVSSITDTSYTFNYNVTSNTLVSPYTSVAFIKAFTPGFSYYFGAVTAPLTVGDGSITVNTSIPAFAGLAPGDIIQYGFETTGPNARIAAEPGLGKVVIAPLTTAVPEPASLGLIAAAIPLLARRRRD